MIFTADPLQDDISLVQYIDHMGDDLRVVNAARVSMDKESDDFSDRDASLIRYLAEHNHWTPAAQPQITLRIRMPLFVARQYFKHQIGITRNEVSRRYVDTPPQMYVPESWRQRGENIKQGSSDQCVVDEADCSGLYTYLVEESLLAYKTLLAKGVAPEMARIVLPQSMYTEFIETGSLAAYIRIGRQRLDSHAQWEVRKYAEAISNLMGQLFPVTWSTYMEA